MRITDLVRPRWKSLTLAFVAVPGGALTGILDPRPIRVVVDRIQHWKALPGRLGRMVTGLFCQGPYAVLNVAAAAVAVIAIVGAVTAHIEQCLTASISQWVGHDVRRTIWRHADVILVRKECELVDQGTHGELLARV
ncbi:MAG: hypothetical protein ACM3H9_08500, partial [Rhodospirillaceae bacterium]